MSEELQVVYYECKRQEKWYTRVVIACRLGGGQVLGERNYVACHAEDPGVQAMWRSHRKDLGSRITGPSTGFVRLL